MAPASGAAAAVFSCPALNADLLASRSGVYGYESADENAPNNFGITFSFPLGAAHSTELQYVFGKIPDLDATPPFTTAQFALSAQMMGYWTASPPPATRTGAARRTGPGSVRRASRSRSSSRALPDRRPASPPNTTARSGHQPPPERGLTA